ncbi:MAG: YdeI/OmpD-associated family protein [Melioribacteraceae bacterium]|nr:YdeI/OmpD-associated family protein [Melioribacteraceae bacterium]
MVIKKIATGFVNAVSNDLRRALISDSNVLEKWSGLTPLARNEWICWVTIVKKQETRKEHVERLCSDLLKGK